MGEGRRRAGMATVRQDAGAGFGKWGAGLREGVGSKAPDYGEERPHCTGSPAL